MLSRKRGADIKQERDSHSGAVKKPFYGFKETKSCNIKVLVSPAVCGKIIGKQGATIKQLQEEHDVHIALSMFGNTYPGTDFRVILITGNNPDGVARTVDFIVARVYEDSAGRPDSEKKVKLVLSNTTVGMVLGKKGADIQKLKLDSGVDWIAFNKQEENPIHYERMLTAVGSEESVSMAFHSIMHTVNRDKFNGNHLEIEYDDMQEGMLGRERGGRDDEWGGRPGARDGRPGARDDEWGGRPGARDGRPGARDGRPGARDGERGARDGRPRRVEIDYREEEDMYGSRTGYRDGYDSEPDYRARSPPRTPAFPTTTALPKPSGGLLGLLGLDMKVTIPEHGQSVPLSPAIIMQLLEHVNDKLTKTTYSSNEFRDIKTSIANLASLGLLSLGLDDGKPKAKATREEWREELSNGHGARNGGSRGGERADDYITTPWGAPFRDSDIPGAAPSRSRAPSHAPYPYPPIDGGYSSRSGSRDVYGPPINGRRSDDLYDYERETAFKSYMRS